MLNYPRENQHSEEKSWHTWDSNFVYVMYMAVSENRQNP